MRRTSLRFGRDVTSDFEAPLLVGVAPQQVPRDRLLTARDPLAYHGRYSWMPQLESVQRTGELLEGCDLAAKAKTRPHRLSGRHAAAALLDRAHSSTARSR